jgi:YVTN family beta-propeller protein
MASSGPRYVASSGRQADALDAFQAARRRLVDELGLEPGPELRELQQRILEHDPTLGARRRLPPVSGQRRSRSLAVVALAALAALVAGVFVLSAGAAGPRPSLARGINGLVAVDAASDRLASATPLPETPGSVEDGGGSLWVADPGAQQVSVIDPGSGAIVDPHIRVSGSPGTVVSGGGAIWVASTVGSTVTRIDPATETVTQTISLPGANLDAIAYGAGGVWAADPVERKLFEINPATGLRERTLLLDLQPSAVAIADGAIWVAGYGNATVEKLKPASGGVIGRVHVGDGPVALAFGTGYVWVANSLDSTVSRIDPTNLTVTAPTPVGSGPTALAAGARAVWVANQYSGTISRIDPKRNRVVATVGVGGAPTSLTFDTRRLWVGVAASNGSHRGGTLVIATTATTLPTSNIDAVDPAIYFAAFNPQFTGLAYDALVNFQQSPGAVGLRLVPDLAVSIPTPTAGGRTYAFQVRPGIRYSDGHRYKPATFDVESSGCFASGPRAGPCTPNSSAPKRASDARAPATLHRASSPMTPPAPSRSTSPLPTPSSSSN